MTIDQLIAIKTAVEEGSMTAAAKKLLRAPSAISMSIKNLEELWGIEIFDRSEYRVKLSCQGESLYPKIKQILTEVQELERHARDLSEGQEAALRISVNTLFPIQQIEKLLRNINSSFPQVQVSISVDHMDRSIKKLKNEEVDFAITRYEPEFSSLKHKRIYNAQLIGVAGTDYISKSSIQRAELQSKTQIIVSSMDPKDQRKDVGLQGSFNQWVVADMQTKLNLIKSNLGYGYMPNYLVDDLLKKKKLREIKIMSRVDTPMYIYHSHNKIIGDCMNYFWDNA